MCFIMFCAIYCTILCFLVVHVLAFCDFEEDNKWGIQWQRTFPNHMDTQACLQNLTGEVNGEYQEV